MRNSPSNTCTSSITDSDTILNQENSDTVSTKNDPKLISKKKSKNPRMMYPRFFILFYIPTIISFYCTIHTLGAKDEGTALIPLHSNSTVILLRQKPSTVLQAVTVIEDTSYPGDFDHEIIIYLTDSDCSEIQILEETQELRGTNLSLINETTTYALTGSSMTYNICGSSNTSYQSERLELVILYGLEARYSPSKDYHKFYYFPHGTDGDWKCTQVTYNIDKDGYYTSVFLTAPQEANYVHFLSYRQRFLNNSSPDYHKLKHDKDRFTVEALSGSQHCCIATVLDNPTVTSPYVHVNISYISIYHNKHHRIVYFAVTCGLYLFFLSYFKSLFVAQT